MTLTEKCLLILQTADKPLTAIHIADRLGLVGHWEGRRRRIREMVKKLRDGGSWIIATLWGGYLLTDDFQLWQDYNEGKKIDALRILVITNKRKLQTANRTQGNFKW